MAAKHFGTGDELDFVRQLMRGDPTATAELNEFRSDLERILISKGASPADAEEIVGNVIGDCCGANSRLKNFKGAGPLSSFLIKMTRFAWIDWVRRSSRTSALPDASDQRDNLMAAPDEFDCGEHEVVALLKEAVLGAFAETEPEQLLILRLVYQQRLKQKNLSIPLGCSEATVSRRTAEILDDLQQRILAKFHELEPDLRIGKDELISLCADSITLFGHPAGSTEIPK